MAGDGKAHEETVDQSNANDRHQPGAKVEVEIPNGGAILLRHEVRNELLRRQVVEQRRRHGDRRFVVRPKGVTDLEPAVEARGVRQASGLGHQDGVHVDTNELDTLGEVVSGQPPVFCDSIWCAVW